MDMIVGQSEQIKRIKELIRQVVNTDLGVMIYGESGVGKELVARALHFQSYRRNEPFVKVNCAALPAELLESELFGYEKGAFTGAEKLKLGKFELAHDGTIFLDEIGDMPLVLQSKLLQVLQDGEFSRVGGRVDVKVNTWIVAATNHDLEEDVKRGLFREDFYYRLNIIKIVVPPLRDRKGDIPLLIDHFLSRYGKQFNNTFTVTKEVLDVLTGYHWPGNVREVENYVKRLLVLNDWEEVKEELLVRIQSYSEGRRATESTAGGKEQADVTQSILDELVLSDKSNGGVCFASLKDIRKKALMKIEKEVIEQVLRRTNWNKKQAAKHLQISYKALLYKVKDMNIKGPGVESQMGQ